MEFDFKVNTEIPIGQFGKSFLISNKNNINGKIIFCDLQGNVKSYVLNKHQRTGFNLADMAKNEWVKFDPSFIEFRTEEDIKTITVDVALVNPDYLKLSKR